MAVVLAQECQSLHPMKTNRKSALHAPKPLGLRPLGEFIGSSIAQQFICSQNVIPARSIVRSRGASKFNHLVMQRYDSRSAVSPARCRPSYTASVPRTGRRTHEKSCQSIDCGCASRRCGGRMRCCTGVRLLPPLAVPIETQIRPHWPPIRRRIDYMRKLLAAGLTGLLLIALNGCVVSPVTGLVCPPGTHPGREGHHCFNN